MDDVSGRKVYEDVVEVPVAKSDDVSDDGHRSNGLVVGRDLLPPTAGSNRTAPERLRK